MLYVYAAFFFCEKNFESFSLVLPFPAFCVSRFWSRGLKKSWESEFFQKDFLFLRLLWLRSAENLAGKIPYCLLYMQDVYAAISCFISPPCRPCQGAQGALIYFGSERSNAKAELKGRSTQSNCPWLSFFISYIMRPFLRTQIPPVPACLLHTLSASVHWLALSACFRSYADQTPPLWKFQLAFCPKDIPS